MFISNYCPRSIEVCHCFIEIYHRQEPFIQKVHEWACATFHLINCMWQDYKYRGEVEKSIDVLYRANEREYDRLFDQLRWQGRPGYEADHVVQFLSDSFERHPRANWDKFKQINAGSLGFLAKSWLHVGSEIEFDDLVAVTKRVIVNQTSLDEMKALFVSLKTIYPTLADDQKIEVFQILVKMEFDWTKEGDADTFLVSIVSLMGNERFLSFAYGDVHLQEFVFETYISQECDLTHLMHIIEKVCKKHSFSWPGWPTSLFGYKVANLLENRKELNENEKEALAKVYSLHPIFIETFVYGIDLKLIIHSYIILRETSIDALFNWCKSCYFSPQIRELIATRMLALISSVPQEEFSSILKAAYSNQSIIRRSFSKDFVKQLFFKLLDLLKQKDPLTVTIHDLWNFKLGFEGDENVIRYLSEAEIAIFQEKLNVLVFGLMAKWFEIDHEIKVILLSHFNFYKPVEERICPVSSEMLRPIVDKEDSYYNLITLEWPKSLHFEAVSKGLNLLASKSNASMTEEDVELFCFLSSRVAKMFELSDGRMFISCSEFSKKTYSKLLPKVVDKMMSIFKDLRFLDETTLNGVMEYLVKLSTSSMYPSDTYKYLLDFLSVIPLEYKIVFLKKLSESESEYKRFYRCCHRHLFYDLDYFLETFLNIFSTEQIESKLDEASKSFLANVRLQFEENMKKKINGSFIFRREIAAKPRYPKRNGL